MKKFSITKTTALLVGIVTVILMTMFTNDKINNIERQPSILAQKSAQEIVSIKTVLDSAVTRQKSMRTLVQHNTDKINLIIQKLDKIEKQISLIK